MTENLTVLYNGSCPICSREVAHYRKRAERSGAQVRFADISAPETDRHGLSMDAAARQLHVVRHGKLIGGVAAFRLLWSRLPGYRWLARVTGWPLIRPLADWGYDRVAAPALYALHRRRVARQGCVTTDRA